MRYYFPVFLHFRTGKSFCLFFSRWNFIVPFKIPNFCPRIYNFKPSIRASHVPLNRDPQATEYSPPTAFPKKERKKEKHSIFYWAKTEKIESLETEGSSHLTGFIFEFLCHYFYNHGWSHMHYYINKNSMRTLVVAASEFLFSVSSGT